ncbi:MAG TPA: hypothetical protein P5287_00540 [bacterium]|nr:hypothetical protein [bacterium]
MVAGVPGIGLSGVFYILCGLFMPVIEFFSVVFGKSRRHRWKLVMTQFSLSAGILLASWGFGLLVGMIVTASPWVARSFRSLNDINVLKVWPFFLSLATLAVVLGSLWLFNQVSAKNRRPRRAARK